MITPLFALAASLALASAPRAEFYPHATGGDCRVGDAGGAQSLNSLDGPHCNDHDGYSCCDFSAKPGLARALLYSRFGMRNRDFRGANFFGLNLNCMAAEPDAYRSGCPDLSGADFEAASLAGAKLRGVKLEGANFLFASLYGARLDEVSLAGSNLMFADLRKTQLSQTRVTGAFLAGAKLSPQSGVDSRHIHDSSVRACKKLSGQGLAPFAAAYTRATGMSFVDAVCEYFRALDELRQANRDVQAIDAKVDAVSGQDLDRECKPISPSALTSMLLFPPLFAIGSQINALVGGDTEDFKERLHRIRLRNMQADLARLAEKRTAADGRITRAAERVQQALNLLGYVPDEFVVELAD